MAQGGLNRTEPRINMVYVSYEFYLIIFFFYLHSLFCTISTCAHHHSSQCSHYQGMTVTGRGFINIAWSAHGLVSCWTWIWLRNGHSGQHVDTLITFSLLGLGDIQWTKLSPAHPHISVSIWEHLAQNHTLVKLLSFVPVMMTGDTAWK